MIVEQLLQQARTDTILNEITHYIWTCFVYDVTIVAPSEHGLNNKKHNIL
jgi:hypothetical protein